MATDDQPDSTTRADGTASQNPASAPGGLLKAGIAAAVVAAAALVFVSGCGKRNAQSSRSSDGDTSSERDGRKERGSHGKVQLWEDGPYWAETNIGAENPEDYGYYFWWGDTVGYKRTKDAWVASDGLSRDFAFDKKHTPTWDKSIDELKCEGWLTEDGVLAPEHDAAHVHWGGGWRIPTEQELEELNKKCDWTYTTKNGVEGCVVQGRGRYASASIFLPCAGVGGPSLYGAGSYGFYWLSDPDWGSYTSWSLGFGSSYHGADDYFRSIGQSVRPVQGLTKQRTK